MSSAHFLRRGRRFALNESSSPPIDPRISDWAARVVSAGAATPSVGTQAALSVFVQNLSAAGIMSKMVSMIAMVPDSFIAATMPIIPGRTTNPWINHNFVSGDLTINGLKGDGSSKYLDTGMLANALTTNSTGVTLYLYTPGTTSSPLDFGAQDGSGNNLAFYPDDAGNLYFDCYNFTVGQGRATRATLGAGYYSGNRTASNESTVYYASSITPHSSVVSISTVGGSLPALNPYIFNLNLSGPFSGGWSDSRLSFVAMHTGLTAADSTNFYNAIQQLRRQLGGGFI